MVVNPERERVGRERMEAFVGATGQLHGEMMMLTMAVGFAGADGYSDGALAGIEGTCRELITAAHALADNGRRLARDWRAQRVAAEREGLAP